METSIATVRSPAKDQIFSLVEQYVHLAQNMSSDNAVGQIQLALERYKLGLFRLVVVGEVKKGKSTFINALLGQQGLLPISSDVATSRLFKVIYGPQEKVKVFFLPTNPDKPDDRPAPKVIGREQIAEYGTEDGNPGNKLGVDFIGMEIPHPMLKHGLVILDTPGLGGLAKKHAEITWGCVPNADAIFFVLESVESPISADEVAFLKRLQSFSPAIFFVQTKIDEVDENIWQSWADRNKHIIGQALQVPKDKLLYFPLSSTLKLDADKSKSYKDLDRSGFLPLLDLLHGHLIPAKQQLQARALLEGMGTQVGRFCRQLSDQRRIVSETHKAGLDQLEEQFGDLRAKFEKWERSDLQVALRGFTDKITTAKQDAQNLLIDQLDPSPSNRLIAEIVDWFRNNEFDPRKLNEEAAVVQSRCVDGCSQIVFGALQNFNRACANAVQDTLSQIGGMTSTYPTPQDTTGSIQVSAVDGLHMHFSGFDETRATLYGGMAGTALAGVGISLLSAIFPPAGAVAAIAAVAAGVFGAKSAHADYVVRRKDEAVQKLLGVLMDTVRTAQRQAIQNLSSIASDFERRSRDAIDKACISMRDEFQGSLDEVTRARKSTAAESSSRLQDIKKKLTTADVLLKQIGQLVDQMKRRSQAN